MDTKQILEKKQYGDIKSVAEILNVNYPNVQIILRRPNSKLHTKAVNALAKIIEAREKIIQEEKQA